MESRRKIVISFQDFTKLDLNYIHICLRAFVLKKSIRI